MVGDVAQVDVLSAVTQFGVAGLIGWMWLTERRAAAARERQLRELHDRLMRERRELDVLVTTLGENTRALTAVEVGQRAILAMLGRMGPGGEQG